MPLRSTLHSRQSQTATVSPPPTERQHNGALVSRRPQTDRQKLPSWFTYTRFSLLRWPHSLFCSELGEVENLLSITGRDIDAVDESKHWYQVGGLKESESWRTERMVIAPHWRWCNSLDTSTTERVEGEFFHFYFIIVLTHNSVCCHVNVWYESNNVWPGVCLNEFEQ